MAWCGVGSPFGPSYHTENLTMRLMKIPALLITLALLTPGLCLQSLAQPEDDHDREAREPREIERHIVELKTHLAELMEAGHEDQAAEVKRKLTHLQEENHHNHAEIKERQEMIRREITELHQHGNHEEAEQLEREHFGNAEHQRREAREGDQVPELHRRLHHLQVAIENLRIAGFPEPADQLEKQARNMMQEIRQREIRQQDMNRPPQQPGGVDKDARNAIRRLEQNMGEVERALDQMRRRMEEMHERMER
jgi:hypothetical protein